jgi:hypothetical protein
MWYELTLFYCSLTVVRIAFQVAMSGNASAPSGDDASLQEPVSPVTLSDEWSRVARLLLIASLAVIGSVGNIFMISSVMIEDHLKKRGRN